MADKLAKKAASSGLIDITFSRIPLSLVNYEIQSDSIKRWQINGKTTPKR
jgi:hypothetical protein